MNQEIDALLDVPGIDWRQMDGATVLVTGATGLVGSYCVRMLLACRERLGVNVRVRALVRNERKARDVFADCSNPDTLEFVVGDLAEVSMSDAAADYYIHAGCPTASQFFMEHPVETSMTIVLGTRNMLEAARAAGARSFVYVSSMEVYGDGRETAGLDDLLDEHHVGFVDPLSVRSCYPEGKRMAEQLCVAYASEYGVNAKIARLAQTFGPGIPKDDKRIFAMMARRAMEGADIVLKTTGASTRMYAYIGDAVRALFFILLQGQLGEAYNVANKRTYSSVREMGEMVARQIGGGEMEVRVQVDDDAPYPPEHHLPLDVSKLEALGWLPTHDLPHMYQKLVAYLDGSATTNQE